MRYIYLRTTLASLAGLALVYILAGCATVRTERVNVPVPVPCNPPVVASPPLAVDGLDAQADIFEYTRALWASVEQLESHADQLQAALEACRSHP